MNRNRLFQIELTLRKESVHPIMWRWYPSVTENRTPRGWAMAFNRVERLVWFSTVWGHLTDKQLPKLRAISDTAFDTRWRFQFLKELKWVDPTMDQHLPVLPTTLTPDNVGPIVMHMKSLQRKSLWRRMAFAPFRLCRELALTMHWCIFEWPLLLYEINVFVLLVYLLTVLTVGMGLWTYASILFFGNAV